MLQDQLGAKDQQLLEAKVSATAEHEGKTYRFVVPKFKTRDGEFTAEEAANNPELVAKLVACGASVIEVVK